jgi:hypothetical protein
VTRGTRPKKPSSSRGFACEARGARGTWGSWGSKIEIFFALFSSQQQQPKIYFILYIYIFSTQRWSDGVARRNARQGQTECPTGLDGGAQQGRTGCPMGARWGGQTGCPTGPDGCHVIGHVIFECHVTRPGWQGIILFPTLVSQR